VWGVKKFRRRFSSLAYGCAKKNAAEIPREDTGQNEGNKELRAKTIQIQTGNFNCR